MQPTGNSASGHLEDMRIKLRIKDVEGMTDDKRHILLVNKEDLISCLQERNVIDELLNDHTVRNTIYMQEKAKRDKKERERAARGRKVYQEILDSYGEQ